MIPSVDGIEYARENEIGNSCRASLVRTSSSTRSVPASITTTQKVTIKSLKCEYLSEARKKKKVIIDLKLEEGSRASQIRSTKFDVVTALQSVAASVRRTFIADMRKEKMRKLRARRELLIN
nr:pollen allergen Che A 1 [Ipomoea batatas]